MGTQEGRGTSPTGGSANEPTAEDILATGPPTRELDSALAKPPRRGRGMGSTSVLIIGVLLAAVFVGGLFLGRATAPESATAAFPGGGDFPGGGPGADGGNIPGFGGDGFTAGTISRIDGDTIYVETADGETVEVRTDADTDVQVTTEGSVEDLAEGESVIAQGDSQDDGSLEATSIAEGGLGFGSVPN